MIFQSIFFTQLIVLSCEGLMSTGLLLYAQQVFDPSFKMGWIDIFFNITLVIWVNTPYVLAGIFSWLLNRKLSFYFLLISIGLGILSFRVYYFAYFPKPEQEAGMLFFLFPVVQ